MNGSAFAQHDYPVKPVPFTAVHLDDIFWAPRIETNRTVTIPFAFEQCEKSGRMDNFERAAKALRGGELTNRKAPGTPFDDTDPYKVIEGASYALAVQPDPKMSAFLDVRGPGGDDYHQSRIKPVDQTEAIGHAVRAGYLYSGMADVAALTGDERYLRAIDAIWENAVSKKLYITGGIGAVGGGEAFG